MLIVCSVAYRGAATAALTVPAIAASRDPRPLISVVVFVLAVNGTLLYLLIAADDVSRYASRKSLVLDTLQAFLTTTALTIAAAPTGGTRMGDSQMVIGWASISGTVSLWTGLRGPLTGLGLCLASMCIFPVVVTGAGLLDQPVTRVGLAAHAAQSIAAFIVMSFSLPALKAGVASSNLQGLDVGAHVERVRSARMIHDSVLQTLEAIRLIADTASLSPGTGNASQRLSEVGQMAGSQADRLRAEMAVRDDMPTSELRSELLTVLANARERGLHVRFLGPRLEDVSCQRESATALARATAEALTNVAKHSGTQRAVVRLATDRRGVTISVRDYGRGFNPSDLTDGFGIRQSIVGRLAEVQGRASIDSRPGGGTTVNLWVPSRPPATASPPFGLDDCSRHRHGP